MKRATRRSSTLPLAAIAVEEKRVVGSTFDTKISMPSFTRRLEKLTEDQRAAIIRTGFGNLLNIPNQMISKVLLGELIERWDSNKMTFKLLHGELTITPEDVALILGLRVIGKSVVLGPFSDLETQYGATPRNREINISVIEDKLESLGGLANEDFVRSFLLFTFAVFLFPNSSGKVDTRFLTLLEDLDKVKEYAWGEAVRQDLFSWITKRKIENMPRVGGCLLLLQVWSYEHIDIGRPNLLSSGQFPRASCYESIRHQRQTLSTKMNNLEEDQITWVLHPTTRESEIDVVKQFLEAEIPKEEGHSSVSISGVIKNDESITCHPEMKVTAPLQCAPSKELLSEASYAASDITQSCSETKETAESPYPQNQSSEKGLHSAEKLVSEESFDMPLEVCDSPEISCCTRDLKNEDDDYLPSLSQKFAKLQLETVKEVKKENVMLREQNVKLKEEIVMLREQVLLIPQLQEENVKLQEENVKLKAEVEESKQHDEAKSLLIDFERMIDELYVGRQDLHL